MKAAGQMAHVRGAFVEMLEDALLAELSDVRRIVVPK